MGNCYTKTKNPKKQKYKLNKTNQMGLCNLGNSCYINSVIHSLQSLSQIYFELNNLKLSNENFVSYCILKILKSLNENNENGYEKYINGIKKVEWVLFN